jgi:vacuolar-type H+-ATPase subunit F/Vma7
MAGILYLGDEVTAAGFRLAGVETRVTDLADAADALSAALESDLDCVLLSGGLVSSVPPALLERAEQTVEPLFCVVPDVRGRDAPPDLARDVRNALGIEA